MPENRMNMDVSDPHRAVSAESTVLAGRTVLAGSERSAPVDARRLGAVDPDEPVTATVVVRPADDTQVGADPADVATVVGALQALGLHIDASDAASRRVRVSAPAQVAERAFGTSLHRFESPAPDGSSAAYRARTGGLSVPAMLDGIVVAVLGLDNRPQARSHLHAAAATPAVSYTPPELGALYRFPPEFDGAGTTIAVIELGGGYDDRDLQTYFEGLGIAPPSVTAVAVDGAANNPGVDAGADGEVLLDIEVAGALAPGAAQRVYFAPNTDAGFLNAVSEAVHATVTPVAISISWGQNEDQWTAQARTAMDGVFADAAKLGITVTAAAGDSGSGDGAPTGSHADFPASSPHVLACGGTTLRADAATGMIQSETVWNNGPDSATGGGVSDVFGQPAWQRGAGVPEPGGTPATGGRGVPDVAANADPQTGYRVLVHGTEAVYGGTSAVAPLWAALVARLAHALGRPLGLLSEQLYVGLAGDGGAPGFHDITVGDNGAYRAAPGWDPCTGLGTPDGTALLEALRTRI